MTATYYYSWDLLKDLLVPRTNWKDRALYVVEGLPPDAKPLSIELRYPGPTLAIVVETDVAEGDHGLTIYTREEVKR